MEILPNNLVQRNSSDCLSSKSCTLICQYFFPLKRLISKTSQKTQTKLMKNHITYGIKFISYSRPDDAADSLEIFTVIKIAEFFFKTPLTNCVFMFINFYFCWDIDFFLVSSFSFFSLKTLHWTFWKLCCLFLYVVYQCENVLCKPGETPPFR